MSSSGMRQSSERSTRSRSRDIEGKSSHTTSVRSTIDLVSSTKHVLEKSSSLNEQLKDRVSKVAHQWKNEKNIHVQFQLETDHRNWNALMTRCQLTAYSANLLANAAESVEQTEIMLSKTKNEFRKAIRENKELKASIAFVIEKIYDTEGRLASAKEATVYWRTMYELNKMDYSMYTIADEIAVWHDAKIHDVEWRTEAAAPLIQFIEPILTAIDVDLVQEATKLLAGLVPPIDPEDMGTYATLLELVTKRLYEHGHFEQALEQMQKVVTIRSSVYGTTTPIVAASLNCLALIYSGMKNMAKATETAYQALKLFDGQQSSLTRHYERTGNLLVNWGYYEEGIRLMQMALRELEHKLPAQEQVWSNVIYRMARSCNDATFHEDAMAIGCELIDYYHEHRFGPITDRNPTIYEIAYSQQMSGTQRKVGGGSGKDHPTMSVRLPDPVYLPPPVKGAMKEVAIAYACRCEFRAAHIIRDYIDKCATSCQEDPNALDSSPPKPFRAKTHRNTVLSEDQLRLAQWNAGNEPKTLQSKLANIFKKK